MRGSRRGVAVAAMVGLLGACGGGGAAGGRSGGGEQRTAVAIRTFQFMPPHLEVKAGVSVTWTNHDDIAHTVTAGAPGSGNGAFDAVLGGAGSKATHAFPTPGTQAYFCNIHQSMRGEVVVS